VQFSPFRTLVLCADLLALLLHGSRDGRTAALALAVLAVWAAPVIRDARRGRRAAALSAR